MKIPLCMLCLAAILFPYNFPDPSLDSVGNRGPWTFYPDSAKDRLYKMPWDSGLTKCVDDGPFNRPNSHHKGYEFDWLMPWGHPILAARAGYITFVGHLGGPDGDNCIQVSHVDRDTNGVHTTRDLYLHVQVDSPLVKIGQKVEQGQLIARQGQVGMYDHLHLEVQMDNHIGQGWKYDTIQPIESVPAPFVEVLNRPDGIPWRPDCQTSKNKRYVPSGVETQTAPRQETGLRVFPNPFQSRVTIRLPDVMSAAVVTLLNLQGRVVGRARPLTDSFTWDASRLPEGIYLIRVRAPGGTLEKRVFLLR